MYFGESEAPFQEGVTGRASIEPSSAPSQPCPRNPMDTGEVHTECDIGRFSIELATEVAPVKWEGRDSLAKGTIIGSRTGIQIASQEIPGFRVKVYCKDHWRPRQGCYWRAYEDSVRQAAWRRQDSVERAARIRRDSVINDSLNRLDSIWQTEQRRKVQQGLR
jgi:hypothetical protein